MQIEDDSVRNCTRSQKGRSEAGPPLHGISRLLQQELYETRGANVFMNEKNAPPGSFGRDSFSAESTGRGVYV
jgi:hypothetical protein